jgi:hypothetical protein
MLQYYIQVAIGQFDITMTIIYMYIGERGEDI